MKSYEALNKALPEGEQLTRSQYGFVKNFKKTGNGMKSIRDAGYKHSTPGSQSSAAYRMLRNPKVTKALELI